jgi:novobiocin biosynthesis protein NovU/D-mycarose 3-C-methyltransferase
MYMPGVHIPIVDPSVAREYPPDYFLVLAWNYFSSILSQEQDMHDK